MRSVTVNNLSNKQARSLQLGICENFFSRLRGLMFTRSIQANGGLFFINPSEDRINSAIHMFFMGYDLSIIWVDSSYRVVDKVIAHRWKTLAAPQKKAKYILETHVDRFAEYNFGDTLEFIHV